MEYPSISEYKEAVQYVDSFESEDLRALKPVMMGGEPVMTSGNFAVVFKMQNEKTGELFALKCFTQDQNNRAEAYNKIIEELRYIRSPYFINLEYINEGIWAGDYDNAFPVLLMPWVEGESLDIHIAKLADKDPERLQLVSYEFSVMASWLVNQPFAHGDIKPDNIMVRPDGSLVLVDYDGLYVPSMYGSSSREAGTPSFRHPNRPSMAFDEKIDDFPLATINLSLYLISLKPSLLKKYDAKDRLLFSETDFINLSESKLQAEIGELFSDAQLQRLYALFLIALSEGSLQKCDNTLMLVKPPYKDFKINKLRGTQTLNKNKDQSTNSSPDLVFDVNGVKFTMKFVEGGTFMMGASDEYIDLQTDDEKPLHKVNLDSYYIGETQVTQELWQTVMGNNPSCWQKDRFPVEQVSWDDCQEFIKKLNNLTGKTFALPTEAQWEYAARGGNKSKGYLHSGGNDIDEVGWYEYNSGGDDIDDDDEYYAYNSNALIHEVAIKKANELGLYDMTGNVWEWCNDWFDENYYSNSPEDNPKGPTLGKYHVLRGGDCDSFAGDCRVSSRYYNRPTEARLWIGFRLVLNLTPQDLIFNVNGVQFKMKYVEGGTFVMGLYYDEFGCDSAVPAHKVKLDSYYIAETQVTHELWKAVMGDYPLYFKGDRLPVETVSWNDCQEFIKKLNGITGKTFVLPTEAQWEYAARGGNKSKRYLYSGSNDIDEVAWYNDRRIHQVATKKANELGLYDMSGNVEEWCNDWYDNEYYAYSPLENPKGPSSGFGRVLRGGSWAHYEQACRVFDRRCEHPSIRYKDSNYRHYGLRLALYQTPPDLEFYVNGVLFKMKYVEGGTFMMGASDNDGEAKDYERPSHRVKLNSYYMGETQVTQDLWQTVMGNNPSHFKGEYLPVIGVSWNDCQEFIQKLNIITGMSFSLPTEAQWEYAARGGSKSKGYRFSGSDILDEVAWYRENTKWGEIIRQVATKKANELGLHDMSGNVCEWCNDCFDENYYSNSSEDNPTGPLSDRFHVLRGGCSRDGVWNCQVFSRRDSVYNDLNGLRLALQTFE